MINFTITDQAGDKLLDQLNTQLGEKLRISIEGGGCAGMEYKFELEKVCEDDDLTFTHLGADVVIDPVSAQYLNGATLDYISELFNARFVLSNPNATTTCGCGQSFVG